MNKITFAVVCVLCVTVAHATDVATTQAYVDSAANALQDNLPAKTSDKVVTYTNTAGTTGEREIKTALGNESTNQADNGIPTVGTVKTAVDDKQNKLNPLNNVNIVTYSGTSNSGTYGRGVPTTTPIYDSTVNTFDNGLVTAKTLNDAVIAGVEAEVTKIQTPKGALWRINRTAPKVLPTTANLPANIEGTSYCYKNVDSSSQYPDTKGSCSSAMFSAMSGGDWGTVFPYETGITYPSGTTCTSSACGKEIYGISACSDIAPNELLLGMPIESQYSSALEASYNNCKNGCTLPTNYKHCYCKLINPTTTRTRWVYGITGAFASTEICVTRCATYCATRAAEHPKVRATLFGAAPVSAQ